MSEKLASAEIDESRKRFEKWATDNNLVGRLIGLEFNELTANYVAEQLAKRWPTWQAAERDTRERCAQLAVDAIKETMRDHFPSRMFTSEIELVCVRVAQRIRGVNR